MKYYIIMEDFLYPEPPSITRGDADARCAVIRERRGHAGRVTVVEAANEQEAQRKAVAWWRTQRK